MKKNGHLRALRRIAIFMMAVAVVFTSMPFAAFAATYDAESELWAEDIGGYIEDLGGHNAKTQAIIDYVVTTYSKPNMKYKGKGQCYGYAEMIRKMFGKGSKQKKLNVKPTSANIWKYIKGCKPGTHMRFSQKTNGGGWCHSIVLLKVTKNRVWITEGNVNGKNGIRVSYLTPAELAGYARSYGYIAWIRQPKGSPTTVSKLDVRGTCAPSGRAYLSWRPLKKAKSYEIYRSTSKNSGYKKIATVKTCRFVDAGAPMGTVYYKVKAKGKTSPAVALRKRLAPPKAYLKHSVVKDEYDDEISKITLTWNAVPGATRYIITDYNRNDAKTVVTGTSYVMEGYSFFGSVRASNGNSVTDSYESVIYWDSYDWSDW